MSPYTFTVYMYTSIQDAKNEHISVENIIYWKSHSSYLSLSHLNVTGQSSVVYLQPWNLRVDCWMGCRCVGTEPFNVDRKENDAQAAGSLERPRERASWWMSEEWEPTWSDLPVTRVNRGSTPLAQTAEPESVKSGQRTKQNWKERDVAKCVKVQKKSKLWISFWNKDCSLCKKRGRQTESKLAEVHCEPSTCKPLPSVQVESGKWSNRTTAMKKTFRAIHFWDSRVVSALVRLLREQTTLQR